MTTTTNTELAILTWGQRWEPLAKSTHYAFSLRVDFEAHAFPADPRRVRLAAKRPDEKTQHPWSTFHVFDDDFVPNANGTVRDVPRAKVAEGLDWVDIDPVTRNGRLAGQLRLQGDTHGSKVAGNEAMIALTYEGVISLEGGMQSLFKPSAASSSKSKASDRTLRGQTFIVTRHESSHPKYRWLVQMQLMGFGRVEATVRSKSSDAIVWDISLDVDLYSGL